ILCPGRALARQALIRAGLCWCAGGAADIPAGAALDGEYPRASGGGGGWARRRADRSCPTNIYRGPVYTPAAGRAAGAARGCAGAAAGAFRLGWGEHGRAHAVPSYYCAVPAASAPVAAPRLAPEAEGGDLSGVWSGDGGSHCAVDVP